MTTRLSIVIDGEVIISRDRVLDDYALLREMTPGINKDRAAAEITAALIDSKAIDNQTIVLRLKSAVKKVLANA